MKAGKYMGFKRISNDLGQFMMLALDQRGALRKLIKSVREVREPEDLVNVKTAILKSLAKKVTAVLIDPEYGFPNNLRYVPAHTGVIVATEKTGYAESGEKGRLSELVCENIVEKIKRSGADAAKLLLYWSENASQEVKTHQMNVVREVGNSCQEQDLLYVLEIVTYDTAPQGIQFNVMAALELFSEQEYGVDLFKIQPFLPENNPFRHDIERASRGKPWVILSGGMGASDFAKIVEFNCNLGSSGFLGGRVIWKDAIELIDSQISMEEQLGTTGLYKLEMVKTSAREAIPYYMTAFFGGHERISIE